MKPSDEEEASLWLEPLRRHFRKNWKWETLLGVLLFFGLIPAMAAFLGHERMGHLGEAFIIWHSFFDTIACVLLAITLFLQFDDVRKREKQLTHQIEAQRFQSVFLPYLSLFQTYVKEELKCGSIRGREVFSEWNNWIQKYGTERLFETYGTELRSYHFRLLELLRFIESAQISRAEKVEYLRLLQAQLSLEERAVSRQFLAFRSEDGKVVPGSELKKLWAKLASEVESELSNVGLNKDFLFES